MAKVTSAFFDDDSAPELRFEDTLEGSAATATMASPKRAANYGATVASPAYGVEEDPYATLHDKKANMLHYQQELEKTQREVREIEARRAKQDRFNEGRRDICERLSKSLSKLDRELYNAQKAVEEISSARESYHHHLEILRSLHIESAAHEEDEMDRAIGSLEDAESEFSKTGRRLTTVLPQLGAAGFAPAAGGLPQDFMGWLRAGAAFSIPLTLAAILVALVLRLLS